MGCWVTVFYCHDQLFIWPEMIINLKPSQKNPLKPTESQEQVTVMQWANAESGNHPDLGTLFHIPNVRSSAIQAKRLSAEGVKAGVPDLFLPVGRAGYFGLWIEMKRDTGKLRATQTAWLEILDRRGYLCAVCWNAGQAIQILSWYLEARKTAQMQEATIQDVQKMLADLADLR